MSMFTLTIAAGTIPANTGRIIRTTDGDYRDRDHPREYGENKSTAAQTGTQTGPSPRIRGEWRLSTVRENLHRDHPREYGENSALLSTPMVRTGPSPRIRGE